MDKEIYDRVIVGVKLIGRRNAKVTMNMLLFEREDTAIGYGK